MSRLPPTPRDQLPADQQSAHDTLHSIASSSFGSAFTYQRASDAALVGPFPVFLAQPTTGVEMMKYFSVLGAMPGLPIPAREVVILAVGAVYKAAYELYAHAAVAVQNAGLSEGVVRTICAGGRPEVGREGFSEEMATAFDVARYLAGTPGPLPQELWERSLKAFGKEGTVALVHYAGFYAYISITLNAADIPVPKDGE